MPKERDPFRKYVEQEGGNKKWKCQFCGIEYSGSATRIRAHLAGSPGYGIKRCEKVDHLVRAEALKGIKGELDKSTGGTSGKGTEGTDTQNSNQLGCAPQQPSFYPTNGTGTASARPQDQWSLPPSDMLLDNLDTAQQPNLSNHWLDAALGYEIAPPVQPLSSLYISEPPLTELYTHPEFGGAVLPTPLLGNITSTSIPQYSNEQSANGVTLDASLYSTVNLRNSLPENLRESRDVDVSTFEEIQMNEVHNPTGGSSLQIDSFLDVDSANRSQDCGQSCVVEVAPVRSNTSPIDTVQHSGQLPPRCDQEDGNDFHRFPLRTPMGIDPLIASQHTSVVDSLVPEASTNPIGPSSSHASVPPQRQIVPHQSINLHTVHQNPTVPSSSWENRLVTGHPQALMDMDPCMPSSSQAPNTAPPPPWILPCGTGLEGPSSLPELDMNEGAPMTSHPNIGNDFEENRALKRKLAIIKDELVYAASLSLKKVRMEVVNWLANMEKLRNDCTELASEDCLLPHQQVDTLMYEVEDLMRQGKGLFEVRETKVNKLIEREMVGEAFQRYTTKILEYLVGTQISRLGIHGMGGVGKTTIMVHIHNRLLEEANYGNVLWITVSQNFNTQRLQDDLWKVLGMGILQENDLRKRAAMLCDFLTKRGKSTIILDDVWGCFDLNEVGIPVGTNGIKLVLTTRSFEVCRQMECKEVIKIEPLSHVEAKSLFLKELGSEETLNLETKEIVKSIVNECAGLPLAIITMARSMRGVTDVHEWKDSLRKLRDSDVEQMDMEEVVLKKLQLSYDCLRKHEVQQCFLSCALYPEDKLIDDFELIEFFIDQGLFGHLETREEQYIRGHTILNKLADVCLLEDHGGKMKMHDLIRDMALHIMRATSIVKAGKGLKRMLSEEYWTDTLEKVSLMENKIEEFPLNMSPNCPKLSTFLFNEGSLHDGFIPNSFFKQLWGLKVLNLSGCNLRELPDSISDLINLKALLLRYCRKLCYIPYLGKLTSLRKLDMYGCVKLEAIKGLEMLVDLRYLDMAYTRIKRVSKGTLGALWKLQYLSVQEVNEEDIMKLCALEALRCQLEDVDNFNRLVRVVSKRRNNPRYYKLTCQKLTYPNHWFFLEPIKQSPLWNCKRRVKIRMRSHCIVSTGGESSGSGICILIPQHVQTLLVINCDGATNLHNMDLLENLEELGIMDWKNLRVLSGRQDEEIIDIQDSPPPTPAPLLFLCLRYLSIWRCPRLKYLFGHGPESYLPHLQKIDIAGCEEMVGITVGVTSPSPHLPLAFLSLECISISQCAKMKRVMEFEWLPHFPKLRRIDIRYCENMEEIIGSPPSYMPVEEIPLEELKVESCANLRKLLPHELLIHLRNLQRINVEYCKGIVEIISRAGQGQEGSIMTSVNNTPSSFQSSISLPKLNDLRLYDLPQLKSICEVPITCDFIRELWVIGCPELNRIPLQLRFHDIKDVPDIYVESEEKWKMLIWDPPNAQAILQSHLLFDSSGWCILEGRRNSQWYDGEDE